MRELTNEERLSIYREYTCPFCASKTFTFGPRGGAAVNVSCHRCNAMFALTFYTNMPFGQLITEPDPTKCQ